MDVIYDDPAAGERLLKAALAIQPDTPVVMNNLAAVYAMQRRNEEAMALTSEIYEKYPDYFFGITNYAKLLVHQGKTEEAGDLLLPLSQRERLHITEFEALCMVHIELLLAVGEEQEAHSWLAMWEEINPEHPHLDHYRQKITLQSNRLGRLARKLRRR